ncbi:MAG: hypothetical protein LUE99_00555 [Bacteroides sp.]|nr:hypothetical protein [Bacteroides sp.]
MKEAKPYKDQEAPKLSVSEPSAEYYPSSTVGEEIKATDATMYWNMLKDLSAEIKLELISKLSASLLIKKKNTKTAEKADWVSQFAGVWKDVRSADDIIEDIYNSRSTNSEIEL